MARWSGWGALPDVFDPASDRGWVPDIKDALDRYLTRSEIQAAARSTQNAHYTPPELAKQMWQVLGATLPTGRRSTVYEPGCGIGVFIATAPDHVDMVGVELDPVTARIASKLHPRSTIVEQSLADHEPPDGLYDAAIGNVPFADVKLHDPLHNPNRQLSIHNHAIVKALDSVKPGGHVMVITSSFTLDAINPTQRNHIARYGSLRHSIRLPESTFQLHAGTRVVTDVLLLQRHIDGVVLTAEQVAEEPPAWLNVGTYRHGDVTANVNQVYLDHTERIVGTIHTDNAMYARTPFRVVFDGTRAELDTKLATIFADLAATIAPDAPPQAADRVIPTVVTVDPDQPDVQRPTWVKPGGIYGSRATGFWQRPVGNGSDTPFTPTPKKDERVLDAVCKLRDTYMTLVNTEGNPAADDATIIGLRQQLNDYYDQAVALIGPISGYTTSTTKNGTDVRRYKPLGGFRKHDPDYATVTALEIFDADTGTATKAAIFTTRQLNPNDATHHCETITDAVAASLHTTGRIDPDTIGDLLSIDPDAVTDQLRTVAFVDPDSGDWIPQERYLSGNVRTKLADALSAAENDSTFESNVDALEAVVPDDVAFDDISIRLGAPWLTPAEHMEFLAETLGIKLTGFSIDRDPTIGWVTSGDERSFDRYDAASSTWGTDRMNAVTIVAKTLRGERIVIRDRDPDGGSWVNQEATVEANQKLDELNNALADWAARDPERVQDFERRYNDTYNSHVAPTYDASWPRPPGLAAAITLRPHQSSAVQRMILDRSVGLFHSVGAGKTWTMAAAAVEMKRLGLAHKPLAVVPNHLIEQFTGEVQRAFPAARLLSPTDRSAAGRARFIAQCAADDFDLVITTAEMFKAIPVSTDEEARYINDRVDALRQSLHRMTEKGGERTRGRTVKRVENRIQKFGEKLKDLQEKRRDPSLTFEAMGVDMILYDEVHYCKNLELGTARQDLAGGKPAQRALDLDLKLQLLRTLGHNNVMLATGTPVANSFWELWVMMRYLQPDVLHDVGVYNFDDFVAQFGQEVTDFEMTATGKWKLKTRFAAFSNVPELQTLFRTTADIKMAADLDLPRPTLHNNKPTILTVPPNNEMRDYVSELAARADSLSTSDLSTDNMLKIMTDGRKAAVSLRLVDREEPAVTKLSIAAEEIGRIYHATKTKQFLDPDAGTQHPTPGALQIVFLDQGVTGGKSGHGIDLYAELRDRLSTLGVPNVAFIHDAKDPKELFRSCREGAVNVLIGSTAKMGTGMNVQNRAVALYHLDPPWRPADLEQRDGRILRQGNQNETVRIYYVVAEGSLDTLSFQTLERKARMIHAVMSGTNTERTISDLDDAGTTFGDLKAIATGDQRIIDHMRLKKKVGDLEVAKRSWERRTKQATRKARDYRQAIAAGSSVIAALTPLVDMANRGEFQPGAYRSPAGQAADTYTEIDDIIKPLLPRLGGHQAHLGTVAGQQLTTERRITNLNDKYDFAIAGVALGSFGAEEALNGRLTQRMFNQLERLGRILDTRHEQLERLQQNLAVAEADQHAPFARMDDYKAARLSLDELERELYNDGNDTRPDRAKRNPPGPALA